MTYIRSAYSQQSFASMPQHRPETTINNRQLQDSTSTISPDSNIVPEDDLNLIPIIGGSVGGLFMIGLIVLIVCCVLQSCGDICKKEVEDANQTDTGDRRERPQRVAPISLVQERLAQQPSVQPVQNQEDTTIQKTPAPKPKKKKKKKKGSKIKRNKTSPAMNLDKAVAKSKKKRKRRNSTV